MATEKLYCCHCKSHYTIEWNEDTQMEFVEPEFCPFCGSEVHDGEDDYEPEWDE